MVLCGLVWNFLVAFFFFKQKTAYEMRISDWSSDVCSSDLNGGVKTQTQGPKDGAPWLPLQWRVMQSAKTMYIVESPINALSIEACGMTWTHALAVRGLTIETIDWWFLYGMQCVRSEEGRVGKEGVSKGRHGGGACHKKKKK